MMEEDFEDDDSENGTDDEAEDEETEALQDYQELVDDVEQHRDRLLRMRDEGALTPDALRDEIVETVVPMLADLAAVSFDNLFYQFSYLSEHVEPLVVAGPLNRAAALSTESMARINVLLQMFHGSVQVGMQMAPDPAAKQHAARMLREIEQAIEETAGAVQGIVPQVTGPVEPDGSNGAADEGEPEIETAPTPAEPPQDETTA